MPPIIYPMHGPIPVLTTDLWGVRWIPAQLLEVRNGVALVRIGDYATLRALAEVRVMSGTGNVQPPAAWTARQPTATSVLDPQPREALVAFSMTASVPVV